MVHACKSTWKGYTGCAGVGGSVSNRSLIDDNRLDALSHLGLEDDEKAGKGEIGKGIPI
jgi:hypothetical protein